MAVGETTDDTKGVNYDSYDNRVRPVWNYTNKRQAFYSWVCKPRTSYLYVSMKAI